ncbi:MAG TPA: biotin/lipoyl-binding protein [Saprospiraceae bacterium]|nr:biotin/lipoyl-binding protein [Saprospiraceae bacterium]
MARKNKSRLLIYLLLGIIAVLIGIAVVRAKSKPKGIEVEVEKIKRRTISETVSASGKVFPEKEVKISSDVSGEIVELYVEEGDSVKAGQILARIDPESYESAVEGSQASLNNVKSNLAMQRSAIETSKAQKEQIQAQLNNARRVHERNKQLLQDGVISKQDFEASETNVEQLEANLRSSEASFRSAVKAAEGAEYSVKSAEALLKEIQTSLSRTTIAAPTSGVISKLNVEQGERVVGTIQMAGTEMMRLANFNSMEVQVEVSENDILRVSFGDTCDIEVDAYLDEKFKGVVTEIANSAANTGTGNQVVLTSDQVTNFVVKIRILPESYESLLEFTGNIPFRPGMSATVDIYTKTVTDVLSVPIASVTTRDEKDEKENAEEEKTEEMEEAEEKKKKEEEIKEVVFVFEADTARMTVVKTGIQDNEYIEILSGLSEGEEVVSGPYSAISRTIDAGDRLRIKEKKKD